MQNQFQVLDNMQLKTILVKPTPNEDDVKVSRILWENLKTGELQSTSVNSLYLSLGPSMKSMKINVPPEMLPMTTNIQNMLGFGNMIGQIMWASACKFFIRIFHHYIFSDNIFND